MGEDALGVIMHEGRQRLAACCADILGGFRAPPHLEMLDTALVEVVAETSRRGTKADPN